MYCQQYVDKTLVFNLVFLIICLQLAVMVLNNEGAYRSRDKKKHQTGDKLACVQS